MIKKITGVVRGKTIELEDDLGVADGEQVEVTITPSRIERTNGDGLLHVAGALADDWTEQDDLILAQIYQSRHADSREEVR